MNKSKKLDATVKLPDLNGEFYGYPIAFNKTERFRIIPFADWLPPDFEVVSCSRGGSYVPMWYSPARNRMIFEDSGEEMECKDLATWLRKEVE